MTPNAVNATHAAAPEPKPGTASPDVKFEPRDDFHQAIRRRADEYFRTTGLRPRGDARLYRKTAIAASWVAASYVLLVFVAATWWQAAVAAMSLAVATTCLAFNGMHDAGHRAYSERRWVNRLTALTLDVLGGSSYVWATKHNIVHHTYTNITGHDDDIAIGLLGRLSPYQPWRPFHRFQHWYIWPFYGVLPFKWYLFDDFRDVLRGRVGDYPMARPTGLELAFFLGGKLLFAGLAFGIPLLLHPVWAVVTVYVAVLFTVGIVLAVVFQLAHVVEEAAFPMPDPETRRMADRWAAHQVQTTVDYARASRFVTWFVGGLNYQIEHHLLPHVCHVHYPALAGMVEATCREFGVRYQYRQTLSAAIASHFRWLRRLGQPPSPGAGTVTL